MAGNDMNEVTMGSWETTGYVARHSDSSEGLVRRYDRLGLIESRRDPYGRRMFAPGTAARVKELKAKRVARGIGSQAESNGDSGTPAI
jgi:hypothetical protein